jgi:hypothetical protein
MFTERKIVIATKHSKEKVIAPLFEKHFNVQCFTDLNFDSDLFGTFSGEINREDDAVTTVRNKCLHAMKLTECNMGIASEGSFVRHPFFNFQMIDDELLIFIDHENNLEIIVREISVETNFSNLTLKSIKELKPFLENIHFPSHGVIIRKEMNDFTGMEKGIQCYEKLESLVKLYIKKWGKVYLETDMRANFNPRRMQLIEKLTMQLIEKIKSTCPRCQTPGFGITNTQEGLPCNQCGLPTKSILNYIYGCNKCQFMKSISSSTDKQFEDPMYCDYCNP